MAARKIFERTFDAAQNGYNLKASRTMLDDAIDVREASGKFYQHRSRAKKRNIKFLFTFEEWLLVWWESGRYQQMGKRTGQYCMARNGDVGPYAIDNVRIVLTSDNTSEANTGKPRQGQVRHSEAYKAAMRGNQRGRSLVSEAARKHVLRLRRELEKKL